MKTFTYEKTRTCLSGCPNSTYVMNGSVCVDCGRYCKECSGIDCRLCESGKEVGLFRCQVGARQMRTNSCIIEL
jgi:hypothetical protein